MLGRDRAKQCVWRNVIDYQRQHLANLPQVAVEHDNPVARRAPHKLQGAMLMISADL